MECKFCDDFTGICTNGECPMCADTCPVPDTEGICKYEQREERAYMLTPKGCATVALMDTGLAKNADDPVIDEFWKIFSDLMTKCGYAPDEEEQVCPM